MVFVLGASLVTLVFTYSYLFFNILEYGQYSITVDFCPDFEVLKKSRNDSTFFSRKGVVISLARKSFPGWYRQRVGIDRYLTGGNPCGGWHVLYAMLSQTF